MASLRRLGQQALLALGYDARYEPPLAWCARCGGPLYVGDGPQMIWEQAGAERAAFHLTCWLVRHHQAQTQQSRESTGAEATAS